MENQVIACMIQGGILHQNGGCGILHSSNAIALINSTLLHAKATAVQVRHGIDLRRAGIENFFRRGHAFYSVRCQQLVEVLFRICTRKNDIPRLLVDYAVGIRVISIQIHRAVVSNVHRIPELNTLPRLGGQRNHSPAASGIDTAQAVATTGFLRILFKEYGIIIPYAQIAGAINRATIVSRVPAERHASVPAQLYRAAIIPINRAASVTSRISAERHALVLGQRYRAVAIPINRAACVGSRVPAELHAIIPAQFYRAVATPINRAAGGGGSKIGERY